MIARFLLPLFALAVPGSFGQIGQYGPVSAHLKAGDLAPDIVFSKLLNAPTPDSWSQSNLSGQLTAMVFFPDVSHNVQPVTLWNAVVEKFAGKPVQFIWITGEKESTLLPWLSQHPIKGWIFHDPSGETGRAYGLETPEDIIIGKDRRIVGFDQAGVPNEDLLNAALEGRITTTPQNKATIKAFIQSNLVLLDAEPFRMPRLGDHKPAFPPSFTLHVSPSQGEDRGNFSGDDFRALRGYTLEEAITDVYAVNPIRVSLPASLDNNKRYDFSMVLPERENWESMKARLRQGIQDYFHLTARRENRLMETYVVATVPGRKPSSANPETDEEMGSARSSSVGFQTAGGLDQVMDGMKPQRISAIRSVSIDGTADEFCHMLEGQLDRPVVNETNLEGEFEFRVEATEGAANDFLERLRDQLGIVITPEQRNIETLVFDLR